MIEGGTTWFHLTEGLYHQESLKINITQGVYKAYGTFMPWDGNNYTMLTPISNSKFLYFRLYHIIQILYF